jgi:hypothetical protein
MNSNIFPWKTLAIASSAVIILFIGGFLISGNQPVQSRQTHAYKAPANTSGGGDVASTAINSKPLTNIVPPVVAAKPKPVPPKKAIKKTKAKSADNATSESVTPVEETPLDEMVVIGMSTQKAEVKPSEEAATEAHPKNGWASFDNYLKEKAISPDGKYGTVKLTFTVNNDGTCTGFKIKNGLTEAANQKAIDLVKNGPVWTCNANGSTKETTLNVDFH